VHFYIQSFEKKQSAITLFLVILNFHYMKQNKVCLGFKIQNTFELNVCSSVFHLTEESTTILDCHALTPVYLSIDPHHRRTNLERVNLLVAWPN
jgi:hypothetical protein